MRRVRIAQTFQKIEPTSGYKQQPFKRHEKKLQYCVKPKFQTMTFGLFFVITTALSAEPGIALKVFQRAYNQCMVNQKATVQNEKYVSKFCKDEADQSIENLRNQAMTAQQNIKAISDQAKSIVKFEPANSDEYERFSALLSNYRRLNEYYNIFLTAGYLNSLRSAHAELSRIMPLIEAFNTDFRSKEKAKEKYCYDYNLKEKERAQASGEYPQISSKCMEDFGFINLNAPRPHSLEPLANPRSAN